MNRLSEEIISALKSNTYNSVYTNTLAKLPIVVTREGAYTEINGDTYPIFDTGESYLDGVTLVDNTLSETNYTAEELAYLRLVTTISLWKKCRINNVKKFHYNDTWYSHRYSVDYPEETFGILEVSNLPFRPFHKLMNKKSFICRMDQLMFNGIMEPFMLFIDRKFVNWNAVDVVFDCDDTYLLLHGKEYNHYDLVDAEVLMIILPFKTEYIGIESDDIWNMNYNMLHSFLQKSLFINNDDKIEINVPNLNSIHTHRGMVYNVGAWMHTQLYMRHLGLLSDDRINKLKRMILTRITYDNSGNIVSTYNTKFNAFDKDNYDFKLYNDIKSRNIDYIKSRALFKFNSDGVLDLNNGVNIIANMDESLTTRILQSSDSDILLNYSEFNETLFRESFIVFKSGLFNPECTLTRYGLNIFSANNDDKSEYTFILFNPSDIEIITKLSDSFINQTHFINKILENKESPDSNNTDLINMGNECLNYAYLDKSLYKDNFDNGFDTVMNFNPLLLNDLTKSNIKSTVIYGKEVNKYLTQPFGTENRRGLKIPRYKFKDHETYVIVFLNGELIENYSEMYVASNYFLLPIDNDFANGDVIELLFFTYCDNNEIHFAITDNMLSKLEDCEDPEFVKSELFKEYIRPEDTKIFAKYPEEIMIYPSLINKTEDIAFNISYRQTKDDNLYVFKNVVSNKDNELTAVSSRKFIYERLYVDQKAYRIRLDKRFRYCDNQKQYILFINGRRMEDDTFFITIPKYSRPFWGTYLYTRKFVSPEDRIEIFYVPEELCNMNTNYESALFSDNGYIETDKNNIEVPYYNEFYLYFVNGKKIPSSDIMTIDTYTIRLKSDTKTLNKLNINPIYHTTDNSIISYMKGDKLSKYDNMIKYIKDNFGYDELNTLFNSRVKMSDIEKDYLSCNVDHIAIINEIVRDFWVSSGYEYNEKPFIYDYALDEFIIKNGDNYILPALDASPELNIIKNYIRLLYFKYNKGPVFEIGSTIEDLKFEWEFSVPMKYASITLASQYVNDIRLDDDVRSYTYPEPISTDMSFAFKFNTMHDTIDKTVDIKFYNGIYYGTVDEDFLQHYNNNKTYLSLDKLVAIVAKDHSIPSAAEQMLENESISVLKKDNYVIYNLKLLQEFPKDAIDFDSDLLAIYEDGTIYDDIILAEDYESVSEMFKFAKIAKANRIEITEYHTKEDLARLLSTLNCTLQDTVTLDFNKYKVGSNNYFVYACPKRLAYDENGRKLVEFNMPDINSNEVKDYGRDDHTMPIYTNGEFTDQNTLVKLDECVMDFMEEFEYTNPSGYTETYVIWKSNGFFTRKYDDYEFEMSIKNVDEELNNFNDLTTGTESIRIVNTASLTGEDINNSTTMINTLSIKK